MTWSRCTSRCGIGNVHVLIPVKDAIGRRPVGHEDAVITGVLADREVPGRWRVWCGWERWDHDGDMIEVAPIVWHPDEADLSEDP